MTDSPINMRPIAPPDSPDVRRRSGGRSNPYRDAVAAVAEEHPVISPWYAVPGDDEEAQAKALRAIKAAGREIERQVLTGRHVASKLPVWALGGEALRRQRGGGNASVTPTPEAMPGGAAVNGAAKAPVKAKR